LTFSPLAWLKLQWFCHAGPTEIGGFGISSPKDFLYVEDFVTLRQRVCPVSVRFDDSAVADFFDQSVDRGLSPARCGRLWCHTHPGSSVTVGVENLACQGYAPTDLGRTKVEAMAEDCRQLNPAVEVTAVPERFRRSSARHLAGRGSPIVFACVDQIATRRLIWESCRQAASLFLDGRNSAEVIRVLAVRTLNVGNNAQLDELVEQAQRIVRGVLPQSLRDYDELRRHVATQLTQVQATLDGMLVDAPRRRIIRSTPSTNGGRDAAHR